jgi:hypothetical protein
MFKILSTYICWKKIHKMQHLEGSGMPVLYIGRTVLKGYNPTKITGTLLEDQYTFFIISRSVPF